MRDDGRTRPRIALCLEQTLGHRSHTENIVSALAGYDGADVDVHRVEYRERGRFGPPWAVRGSASAVRLLRAGRARYDAALFHTQTISLLARRASPVPRYVVSVDATPIQLDSMGEWYRHERGGSLAEAAKRHWYRWVLGGAADVVAWSDWAAASLRDDYGVDPERIAVLHPGAAPGFFDIERASREGDLPNILFVGGDFERKGGGDLLEAFSCLAGRATLTLVTTADVAVPPGVRVVRDARPGTAELFAAFRDADIFCLPTLGDCTSVALGEAMAAGLPVVTTTVGSNAETVPDGVAGILVPPGDRRALHHALGRLVVDRPTREAMGAAGRRMARVTMRADANARRLVDIVRQASAGNAAAHERTRR